MPRTEKGLVRLSPLVQKKAAVKQRQHNECHLGEYWNQGKDSPPFTRTAGGFTIRLKLTLPTLTMTDIFSFFSQSVDFLPAVVFCYCSSSILLLWYFVIARHQFSCGFGDHFSCPGRTLRPINNRYQYCHQIPDVMNEYKTERSEISSKGVDQ